MKPAAKLPFLAAPAPALKQALEKPARPGFPLRLNADPAAAVATKKIAAGALSVGATGTISLKKLPHGAAPVSATPKTQLVPQRPPPAGVGLVSEAIRARMVQKLAAQGVANAQVLVAMSKIERHRFVDSALAQQAYEDTSLPIGLGQTISKPNVVARMLELLMSGRGERGADMGHLNASGKLGRVLEIGTGCGYQAAVLSQLATEVYSIERLRGLHEKARDNLRPFRVANLHLIFADGCIGHAKGAPFAAIIAAAGGEAIPPAWIEQLAVGGRLVAPLQTASGGQALVVVDKTLAGVRHTVLEAVNFVPLKSGTS